MCSTDLPPNYSHVLFIVCPNIGSWGILLYNAIGDWFVHWIAIEFANIKFHFDYLE